MKRGDIYLVRQGGTPASKGRPCVIIQRTSTLIDANKVTCCPLTSTLLGGEGARPFVVPTESNGLDRPSEIEFDWIFTYPRTAFLKRLGTLELDTMTQLETLLGHWLET